MIRHNAYVHKVICTVSHSVDVLFHGQSNSMEPKRSAPTKREKSQLRRSPKNLQCWNQLGALWTNGYVEGNRKSNILSRVRLGYLYSAWALLSREIVGYHVLLKSDLSPPCYCGLVPGQGRVVPEVRRRMFVSPDTH